MDIEISVVILCYGASQKIYIFVDRVIELLNKFIPSWEIVLVGNYLENKNDETARIVKDISSKIENVKAVVMSKQGGMGWDARKGLVKTTGRYICLIDGDGQIPPQDIIRIYRKIKRDNLDFVKTYRIVRYDGVIRITISHIYNFLFKFLFPGLNIKDVNSKPKIFTREAYNKMHLVSNDWFLDAEMAIQARKLKFKIGNIPSEFYRCNYRKSYVKFGAVFEFIKNLFIARAKEFFK